MAENFPNLKKERYPITGRTEGPKEMNPNRPMPRHIIIKMAEVKERILNISKKNKELIKREPPDRAIS